jgi:hypothetical protein
LGWDKKKRTARPKEAGNVRNWLRRNIDSQPYLKTMQLCQRIEQILEVLRPAFSREATFQWFISAILIMANACAREAKVMMVRRSGE